nr:Maf family protein [Marinicella sp. W31]MDC2879377.1 Maf family protein [Marinicella sp. W31]
MQARAHLKRLSGKTHYLMSAFAIARDGAVLFEACETAALHMRALDDAEIDHYLALISDDTLYSSGIYQLEGPGVRLFDRIDGDFFTILGMPMLQLLAALRKLGALHD